MKRAVTAIAACGAIFFCRAGEDKATSPAYGNIRLDTLRAGKPYAVGTADEASFFATRPITFRAGESVLAKAPDGTLTTLQAPGDSAGSVAFTPTSSGLWQLINSNGSTYFVGVAWSVDGASWSLDFSADAPFAVHTAGTGPDRRGEKRFFPPVAYSGDDFARDAQAAVTLRFVAPDGEASVFERTGTGTFSFAFDQTGEWTLEMTLADASVRTAKIFVTGGFVLHIR